MLFQLTASQGGWRYLLLQSVHRSVFQLTASQGGWRWIYSAEDASRTFQLTASQGGWQEAHRVILFFTKFQLTASQGGWPKSYPSDCMELIFQLTASQGGWRSNWPTGSKGRYFNSQPHKEADKQFFLAPNLTLPFQLTASQGGWLALMSKRVMAKDISTHSLTRRLTICPRGMVVWRNISTHSLTRRLTAIVRAQRIAYVISTHSLTRRLTCTGKCGRKRSRNFNSQPHKEADVWTGDSVRHKVLYFNSQPHKEADSQLSAQINEQVAFQLTASQGGWPTSRITLDTIPVFQLTASQGGWPVFFDILFPSIYFNSQPHKEADGIHPERISGIRISTHSLTRRLTWNVPYFVQLLIFQLTASQGGWHITQWLSHCQMEHFNSQPHKEADSNATAIYQAQKDFNSQPHKEADKKPQKKLGFASAFQLTASQGGWLRDNAIKQETEYFNSQPHKEADGRTVSDRRYIRQISTHSLTRRLTTFFQDIQLISVYFNSQPHKEADHWLYEYITSHILYFNSQPHKEADNLPVHLQFFISISTHSLTRRLTLWLDYVWPEYGISTHSLTRRLTFGISLFYHYGTFQLTASQGGWRNETESFYDEQIFQLTASQGGWHTWTRNFNWPLTFQLTASQGGWPIEVTGQSRRKHFNSQPHKEADVHRQLLPFGYSHFNSQPHKEADSVYAFSGFHFQDFNSQPHKEADTVRRIYEYSG